VAEAAMAAHRRRRSRTIAPGSRCGHEITFHNGDGRGIGLSSLLKLAVTRRVFSVGGYPPGNFRSSR